ncbi:MAG: hypothetical protein AABY22_09490 [Nanoarchaeota archaeon]
MRSKIDLSSTIKYIAGLFDGEGCGGIYKHHQSKICKIQIKMTNFGPIDYVNKHFPGYIGYYQLPSQKWCMYWILQHKSAYRFAKTILPVVKNLAKVRQLNKIIDHYEIGGKVHNVYLF